ncbi:spore germination protein [Orenia marismortui]|uniref:spore germination protein n=1 Tax=Orenia marismortui TaxID=46469 RepID=UPI000372A9EF|nr:spore germination protein [Orenia marismortui]
MFKLLKRFLTSNNKETSLPRHKPLLKENIEDNIDLFEDIFNNDESINYRSFESDDNLKYCLIFASSVSNQNLINRDILKPLMENKAKNKISSTEELKTLITQIIPSSKIERISDIDKLVGSILYGDTLLLVDGIKEALLIETKEWKIRAIEEPVTEKVVKGPREGFNESAIINISLLRRKLKTPDLKFKFKELGLRTKTNICIAYIDDLVNKKILKECIKRIDEIKIDGILDSNYIDELIKDSPFSPFRTIGYTERPDVAVAKLLEGRIIIIVDGTPIVLTLPFLFLEHFQVNEDYYQNFFFGSFNRWLRYLGFFLTISTPAIYLAFATFHQEMIPTPLLLSITAAREGVPFPTIVEALIMMVLFEILREAGVRLPEPVGGAISIVGALVLGQAAVNARFASAPIVIIIAVTAIASFLNYKMAGSLIMVRILFLLLASVLGLYGYLFGVMGLFIHLMSIRSFGIPYMLNLNSYHSQDVKDTALRAPWWYMNYRPKLLSNEDLLRERSDQDE